MSGICGAVNYNERSVQKMKVLIVASNTTGRFAPFVMEQVASLSELGIEFDYFGVTRKGIIGYLRSLSALKEKVRKYHPDLIHAHYGLSGLLANLQREIPVMTTYHGSDIHSGGLSLFFSRLCMWLSVFNIYVSNRLYEMSGYRKSNYIIQPCGINLNIFCEIPKDEARKALGWDREEKYILFAGAFENPIKNSRLAQEAVKLIPQCRLIELKGYDRKRVNLLMNACNGLLLTSFREASPMVVKEAMACGCPIVTVDAGDAKEMIAKTEGCYLVERTPYAISEKLKEVLQRTHKTDGRNKVKTAGFDLPIVASRIQEIYKNLIVKTDY